MRSISPRDRRIHQRGVALKNSGAGGRIVNAFRDYRSRVKDEWFRQHNPDKYPLMVHEGKNKVVAWASFQPFYGRAAYDHTAEISINISPKRREMGLGRSLLAEALGMTKRLDIKTVAGFVFSHDEPSIRMLKSSGLEEWGKLPDIAVYERKGIQSVNSGKTSEFLD